MPGYIFHLTEAKLIIDGFEKNGMICSNQWKNDFLMGNLLPDTKKKPEKQKTHYWKEEDMKNWAIAPDVQYFYDKYKKYLDFEHPIELGYYSHLLLDYYFVNEFWESVFYFINDKGQKASLKEEVTHVYLKECNKKIPVDEFFSDTNYYGDYSRMNDYFMKRYKLSAPVLDLSKTTEIEEVSYVDLKMVLDELDSFVSTTKRNASDPLKVFSINGIETFVLNQAERFVKNYANIPFKSSTVK